MSERVHMMDCGDAIRRADVGCFAKGPVVKTASYTITPGATGSMFSNKGAGAAVTFTLPPAKAGMWFCFLKVAAQNLLIKAAAANKIAGGTAGKIYQNVTNADAGTGTVTIFSDGTDWYVFASVGTWANNNA